jgi:hypothetical protein
MRTILVGKPSKIFFTIFGLPILHEVATAFGLTSIGSTLSYLISFYLYLAWVLLLGLEVQRRNARIRGGEERKFLILFLPYPLIITLVVILSFTQNLGISEILANIMVLNVAVTLFGILFLISLFYLANLLIQITDSKESVFVMFILLFFLPIGIWILQTRINRMYA